MNNHPLLLAINLMEKARQTKASPMVIKRLEMRIAQEAKKSVSILSNWQPVIKSISGGTKINIGRR